MTEEFINSASLHSELQTLLNSELFGIWFLVSAALVFWMQAGFAMVEVGFTRSKNAGNILMKNLLDFCIGTLMFILIGFSLFLGEDVLGFLGKPGFDFFTSYESFDWSGFVFNLMFCATTATIVSGAMAERTKFLSYCVYSAVISALIYPIEAHWIWGGGWLAQIGFHDYAGSCAIHLVGGISALIGASFLGPRIGKFTRDNDGNVLTVNAFPGHNLPLGALGCFILWLGWYGFNGAAARDLSELGTIFLTTTISLAIATIVTLLFTWIRYGKPDVSMCLNASLAGLVGITASCDVTNGVGAVAIGAVSGLLVVFGVWFLDHILHIDDPVGAVAVHFMNGIWGTFAVGLFATDTSPAMKTAGISNGLFYGGGLSLLKTQCIGILSVGAWTAVTITFTFLVIRALFGLRVSEAEEIEGLDISEHGLPNAYADFLPTELPLDRKSKGPADLSRVHPFLLSLSPADKSNRYTLVRILCNENRFGTLRDTMEKIGVTGMTVTHVMGCGSQMGKTGRYRGVTTSMHLVPKIQIDIVVSKVDPQLVVAAANAALHTGEIGDGKIFVFDVEDVVRIRTGESGYDALQIE